MDKDLAYLPVTSVTKEKKVVKKFETWLKISVALVSELNLKMEKRLKIN